MFIEKEKIRTSFGKSWTTYNSHAIVQRKICRKLVESLQMQQVTGFGTLLEVGCGSGLLTAEVLRSLSPRRYFVNDLVPSIENGIVQVFDHAEFQPWQFLEGDAEVIDFPTSLDGIVSTSTVQWFHDLPAFVEKANDALAPGGIFAFSTFGPENFREIRLTMNQGLSYHSLEKIREMVGDCFELLFVHDELEQLHFKHPVDVLRHMKYTGVNGTNNAYWSRKQLQEFEARFPLNDRGEATLTYHPIMILAKKKS